MLITGIEIKEKISISYITKENSVETANRISTKELARPEFYRAWAHVGKALYRLLYGITTDECLAQDLVLDRVEIKYTAPPRQVDTFNFYGYMDVNGIPIQIKIKGLTPIGRHYELMRTIQRMAEEAGKYIQGIRAQQSLWEQEPVGNFQSVEQIPETPALPPSMPGQSL